MAEIITEVEETWGHSVDLMMDHSTRGMHTVHNDNAVLADLEASLPFFQASLFATILEDTLCQLRILSQCNNQLKIMKTMSEMNNLILTKFNVKQSKTGDDLDGIHLDNLHCEQYKINKLDMDRKYITEVIVETYKDLCLNENFRALNRCINDLLQVEKTRGNIAEEEIKNKALRRDFYKQLRQQRNHIKSIIYDTNVKIDELKSQVEDYGLISECRSRYVKNWERARTEQHKQSIINKEDFHSRTIDYFKQKSDHEDRVHAEIEMLINININETMEKVEHWMDKYDTDIEAMELKIQRQKTAHQNMLDKRIKLENTIAAHEKEMNAWKFFVDEREKARLYREKMTNSAVVVQAWWRGLLVRLKMGPYKVAARRGKAPDKKKK